MRARCCDYCGHTTVRAELMLLRVLFTAPRVLVCSLLLSIEVTTIVTANASADAIAIRETASTRIAVKHP